jgi:hypothetical protein
MSKKGFVYSSNDASGASKISAVNAKWYYNWSPKPFVSHTSVRVSSNTEVSSNTITSSNTEVSSNTVVTDEDGLESNLISYSNVISYSNIVSYSNVVNWANQTTTEPLNIPFTPMVWGRNASLPDSTSGFTEILGFNEPDRADQSNMTNQEAWAGWPAITGTGLKVGSPATAANGSKVHSWLWDFMAEGPSVDFVCMHWYGPPKIASFLEVVGEMNRVYQKPVWITEFAVADWSGHHVGGYDLDDVKQFMKDAVFHLERLDFVQRYSWKTRKTSDPRMGTSAIFNDNGSLTELGELYASF